MQITDMREHQISLRFNEEEWSRAEAVAASLGLNVQNAIRLLLKREADGLGNIPKTRREREIKNAQLSKTHK